MTKLNLVVVVLLLLGGSVGQNADCRVIRATDLTDRSAPKFDSYLVNKSRPVALPKLDIASNPIAKTYHTVLQRDIRNGPNFAGHYRLTVWGCGSSCAMFAVVDLVSGKVITATNIQSVSGVHLAADDFLPAAASDYWGFRFMKNSALLVVLGTLNEDESQQGAFYFAINHSRLELIHKTLVKKNCSQ